jgi:hypothetical protein
MVAACVLGPDDEATPLFKSSEQHFARRISCILLTNQACHLSNPQPQDGQLADGRAPSEATCAESSQHFIRLSSKPPASFVGLYVIWGISARMSS